VVTLRKYAGAGLAAGAVLVVAGCGTQKAPAPAGPASYEARAVVPTGAAPVTPTVPPCPASGLRVTGREPDAAMGLRAMAVTVTNCGTRPRTVNGYPETYVLDGDMNRLKVTVHQGSSITTGIADPAPAAITLRPGQRAETVLVWRNTVTDSTVVATTGRYLRMTPAEGAVPQLVPMLVDLGNTGKLDVTAWRRPAG
jgi:hypothetical protein